MGPSPLVADCGPGSTDVSHRAAIHQLPQELIIVIFHLCFDHTTTVKVRTRLVLVCRYWKAVIESTPSFWTRITSADGLQNARNSIAKTGESPIDLTLTTVDMVSADEFLAVVSEKVSRWRSVDFAFDWPLPASFGGLQTSACHSLEKLSLLWGDINLTGSKFTLFDGGPAPDALKDVSFWGVPANLPPMRLSGLSSLVLRDVAYVQMDDLLSIIRNSPELTTLDLQECGSLDPLDGSVGLPIILGSLTACTFELSIPSIHFLLSAIHAPSLDHIELIFDMEFSPPVSSAFSPLVPEFGPSLKRILSTAKRIKLHFGYSRFSLTFGGLKIVLNSPDREGIEYLRDVLDSLMDYSGEKGKDLKLHLSFSGVRPTIAVLQTFNSCPPVEKLTLFKALGKKFISIQTIKALGTPITTSPHGWLFPELEVICWEIGLGGVGELEKALHARYVLPESTRQSNERQHPHLLKEIRFFSESNHLSLIEFRDWEETLRRIHVLTGGARIFFMGSLQGFDTVVP
ncbi:hypothetical protein FRC00_000436 [Tulasnella sp. 408]|nr:hypothetical protein FRC00_000436 [Tulasnella sp. 408]